MPKINTLEVNAMANIVEYARLAGSDLKQRGGEWRGNCPLHGGDNKSAFVVWERDNRWMCFSHDCGGGDAIAFVQKWKSMSFRDACEFITGGEVPQATISELRELQEKRKAEEEETRRELTRAALVELRRGDVYKQYHFDCIESQELQDMWTREGIPPVWQAVWWLGYCSEFMAYSRAFGEWKARTMTIPIFSITGSLLNIRHRIIDPPDPKDKYRPHIQGLPSSVFITNIQLTKPRRTIIVEGEKKAMVTCLTLGDRFTQILGVPGKELRAEEVAKNVYRFSPVWVCYDADGENEGRKLAEHVKGTYVPGIDKIDDLINAGKLNKHSLNKMFGDMPFGVIENE